MSDIENSGTAPLGSGGLCYTPNTIFLTDFFAARAMEGIIASKCFDLNHEPLTSVAKLAYQMADAMLKAREEGV